LYIQWIRMRFVSFISLYFHHILLNEALFLQDNQESLLDEEEKETATHSKDINQSKRQNVLKAYARIVKSYAGEKTFPIQVPN
jgi:hypothetical protein